MKVSHKLSFIAVLAAVLSGCGGGGSGGGFAGLGPLPGATPETSPGAGTPPGAGSTSPGGGGGFGSGNAGIVPTPPATPDPVLPNDVTNGAGTLDAAAYRATASQMGREAGMEFRYGPGPAQYGTDRANLPTLAKRADQTLDVLSDRTSQGPFRRACILGNCGTWQVGGPVLVGQPGPYSSNQGHVAFVADNPAERAGVSDLTITSVAENVFSQKPELSWTNYGGGLDSINATDYKKAGVSGVTNPTAIGRADGRPGWGISTVVAYQSGLLAVSGMNTAKNKATAQLAPGKVPTSVALTNSSEFALVTVWDTVNLRGEVAVVALAGLCDGCTPDKPGDWYDYWGEWNGVYPGLPNLGNIAFMKVLGYIPLPDMKAPTEISATTGWNWRLSSQGHHNLSDASVRQSFNDGKNAKAYARSGVAVVVSKSEKKATFIDLKPLFAYYRSMYFGSGTPFTNLGQQPDQWPKAFSAAPQQMPTVIKTVALGSRPTAVKAYPFDEAKRAWIATQDGTLHTYDLGAYPTDGAASPDSIREVGTVAVGRNPTDIALPKDKAGKDGSTGKSVYPDIHRELIVTSRGDRRIDWVRFDAGYNSGSKVRTLRDSRLIDPISAADTDNHTTESYVLSVADYGGRQLSNYRYGPVIFWNNQGNVLGNDYNWNACNPSKGGCAVTPTHVDGVTYDTEYGGSFALPGKAFHVGVGNTP